MKTEINAPAKINLFLEITGKQQNGYHTLDMIMQSVSLCDKLSVEVTDGSGRITMSCDDDAVPLGETNTAYKAAFLFLESIGCTDRDVYVDIKKNIPSQAGLAGGSADAAAVLASLNRLFDSPLDTAELCTIGERVGADVPFCICGGTMLASGTGTTLYRLKSMPQCSIVIIKPDVSVSTAEAYKRSDEVKSMDRKSSEAMLMAIKQNDLSALCREVYNRFEEVMSLSEIDRVKQELLQRGALTACMTGSGSAVFGIFDNRAASEKCCEELKNDYPTVSLCVPTDGEW